VKEKDAILVTGGTGTVGSRLSEMLARRFPDRVVVAARDAHRARALAARIGEGVRGVGIDVHSAERAQAACASAALVVNCVPLSAPFPLLRSVVEHGCAYTDVSPSLIGDTVFALHERAQQTGARVIAGAGLAPCTSNFIARRLFQELGALERVDVTLQLHLGDEIGAAALASLLALAGASLPAIHGGQAEMFRPFQLRRRIATRSGRRTSLRAPFCDQLWIARSLGVPSAATWLVLEPRWAGQAFALLAAMGALPRLARRGASGASLRALRILKRSLRVRGDDVALIVEATTGRGRGVLELHTNCEAHATAAAASLVARALLGEQPVAPGVWVPDQAISTDWFLSELDRLGLAPEAAVARKEAARHRSMAKHYAGGKLMQRDAARLHCERLAKRADQTAAEYDGLAAAHEAEGGR